MWRNDWLTYGWLICPQKCRMKIIDWVVNPIVTSVQSKMKNWVVRPICTVWEKVCEVIGKHCPTQTLYQEINSLPNPNLPTLLTCLHIHANIHGTNTLSFNSYDPVLQKCLNRNVFHICFTWKLRKWKIIEMGKVFCWLIIVYYVS